MSCIFVYYFNSIGISPLAAVMLSSRAAIVVGLCKRNIMYRHKNILIALQNLLSIGSWYRMPCSMWHALLKLHVNQVDFQKVCYQRTVDNRLIVTLRYSSFLKKYSRMVAAGPQIAPNGASFRKQWQLKCSRLRFKSYSAVFFIDVPIEPKMIFVAEDNFSIEKWIYIQLS